MTELLQKVSALIEYLRPYRGNVGAKPTPIEVELWGKFDEADAAFKAQDIYPPEEATGNGYPASTARNYGAHNVA